mmetsp:Transcript_17289/g.42357  ORF Transcript_17289/g.42357 Transcript_17289/m.42357 type:complete len:126 (-) Transcript_17289:1709-2086(-)
MSSDISYAQAANEIGPGRFPSKNDPRWFKAETSMPNPFIQNAEFVKCGRKRFLRRLRILRHNDGCSRYCLSDHGNEWQVHCEQIRTETTPMDVDKDWSSVRERRRGNRIWLEVFEGIVDKVLPRK